MWVALAAILFPGILGFFIHLDVDAVLDVVVVVSREKLKFFRTPPPPLFGSVSAVPQYIPNMVYRLYAFLLCIVACDVHVMHLGNTGQSCTPISVKYSSIATSSLQSDKGSQVESPKFHFTKNSMFFPFHRWLMISSTYHSVSLGAPKSYGSGSCRFGNRASSFG